MHACRFRAGKGRPVTYKIYLSSTLNDLRPERDAVKRALGGEAAVKESYGASEDSVVQTCLDDVEECDAYILVVGLRYGYRPTELLNPNKLSITELEYQQAVDKKKPRYVFLKDESQIAVTNTDVYRAAVDNLDPTLIQAFRKRVGSGAEQTPAIFETADKLELAVTKAFSEFKSKRLGTTGLLGSVNEIRHPAEMRTDMLVLCAKGTDTQACESIRKRRDSRFDAAEISPDSPHFLLDLDRLVRNARAPAFLISKDSLKRFSKTPAFLRALRTLSRQFSKAVLLLDGVVDADLPNGWLSAPDLVVERIAADGIGDEKSGVLVSAHQKVRAASLLIADDRRVGVPCMVVALNDTQITELITPAAVPFDRFQMGKATRENQFKNFSAAIKSTYAAWPAGFYGQDAEQWRPFGPKEPSGGELLSRAFDRINVDQRPGSRERRLLRDMRLQPMRYSFEDYCDDKWGSAAVVEEARDRGCLVLLDELALLHPDLRSKVDSFLRGQHVAIVSANPCDPAHLSIAALLDEFSHLKVGTLLSRFRDEEDPRCELSLNNTARLQRWLRLVLPELITTLGQQESKPELVARAAELLKPAP